MALRSELTVAPPLLPQPFALLSQWLPSGATVSSLRNAIYFQHSQLARPLLVLGVWGTGLFLAWILLARRRQAPAAPRMAITPRGGASSQPPILTGAKRVVTPNRSTGDELCTRVGSWRPSVSTSRKT